MRLFLNMDCMEGMKEYPDNYFDLAIVDPPYGGVTQGGYMTNNTGQRIGSGLANQKGYHAGLWEQERPSNGYFKELFRVSKNQIIWGGGTTSPKIYQNHNVGLYGIKNTLMALSLRIVSLRGLLSIKRQGYSDLCGMGCCKAI